MKCTIKAWIAGIVDGEGCIFITRTRPEVYGKKTKTPVYRLGLKITMGCRLTIERLVSEIGYGTFQFHVPRGEKINASYSYLATSRNVGRLIKQILPYLFTKRAEAEVALEFLSLPIAPRGGSRGGKPVPKSLLRKKESLWKRMRMLKPRNRFKSKRWEE